jgi:multiple sugar transport system ATP-binding protein
MTQASLLIRGLSKSFGESRALAELDLDLRPGELVALVGPSGSGKTTALHLIAGLLDPDAGTVELDGRSLSGVDPRDRDIAMVFQDGALYPHLTVRENLAFPLKARGRKGKRAVPKMAERLGIETLLDRKPAELSGGERQRVALGRALIRKPKLFLLDEPLSSLDAPLRRRLAELVRELVEQTQVTTLYVTHDQAEAMAVGQRLAVMKSGALMQLGTPREIYDRPSNVFVAEFFGSPPMNLLAGSIEGNRFQGPWGQLATNGRADSPRVLCGFRPEKIRFTQADSNLAGPVARIDFLGHEAIVTVALGESCIQVRLSTESVIPQKGTTVGLAIAPDDLHFFDSATGERLE